MVKLDVSLIRFLEEEDFRVLTALEMAMRNHDVAPTVLVERIAQLPHGGCRKRLMMLLKHKMIHHENTMYDGYAMKYAAYDYLALRTLSKRGSVSGVAHRIGCGKESDIVLVHDENNQECVLKLQRLGRCSFRTVSRNRDYKGGGKTRRGESWFYLSRLASQKEYSFMKILYDEGFPVPKPIDQNRHALVMELVPGTLLNNITVLGEPEKVYKRCLDLMVKLGEAGLIHGDFNEFNLMVTEELQVVMIDFPQMVSINHKNAEELFDRDVSNLAKFFVRRFKIAVQYHPTLKNDVVRKGDLDHRVFASGHFTKKHQENLEELLQEQLRSSEQRRESEESSSDEDEEDFTEERHFDPVVPLPFTRNALASHEDEEEGERDSDSDSEGSLNDAMENAKMLREEERGAGRGINENFLEDGSINAEHLKKQVRKNIRRQDTAHFYKNMHRNTQKGRQKQSIRRQVKNATAESGFYD